MKIKITITISNADNTRDYADVEDEIIRDDFVAYPDAWICDAETIEIEKIGVDRP